MGQIFVQSCESDPDFSIAAGFSRRGEGAYHFPVFCNLNRCISAVDVLVDFSSPCTLNSILAYCISNNIPAVLAVTGYSGAQLSQIYAAAEQIPVFYAENFSFGAYIMLQLARYAAQAIGSSFDISIIEHHHKSKADRPSGTAKLLANELHCKSSILSIRAGSSNGKHSVLFIGEHEILEITHAVESRDVYVAGVKNAIRFILDTKSPGLYGMTDLIDRSERA